VPLKLLRSIMLGIWIFCLLLWVVTRYDILLKVIFIVSILCLIILFTSMLKLLFICLKRG